MPPQIGTLKQPTNPAYKAYAIIGIGKPTLYAFASGTPHVTAFKEGDGTVPIDSAQGSTWATNHYYVEEEHTALPNNDQVLKAIEKILSGQEPDNLTAQPGKLKPRIEVLVGFGYNLGAKNKTRALMPRDAVPSTPPIQISLQDANGEAVGARTQNVSGAGYLEFDDSLFLWAPADTQRTLSIQGQAATTMDVTVRFLAPDGAVQQQAQFSGLPVVAGSSGTLTVSADTVSTLRYDSAGNGTIQLITPIMTGTPPQSAMAAVYHFDEGSGTTAHDSSGHSNDATTTGATYVPGYAGTALHFRKTQQDHVTLPQSVFAGFGNTAYFQAWIRPASYTGTTAGESLAQARRLQRLDHRPRQGRLRTRLPLRE